MDKKIMLAVAFSTLLLAGCVNTTKNGEHTGYATAVEENGVIWKTPSVYIKSDVSSSQEDHYCVGNLDVLKQLKTASENKEKITILFHDEMFVAPWRCGDEIGIIDAIK